MSRVSVPVVPVSSSRKPEEKQLLIADSLFSLITLLTGRLLFNHIHSFLDVLGCDWILDVIGSLKKGGNNFGQKNKRTEIVRKMEDELKCPSCRQFFTQPVLLPCFHAMCLNCALHNQQPVVNNLPSHPTAQPHEQQHEQQQEQPLPPPPTELQLLSELQCHDCNDSDQLSILSETDSGVVVSTSGSSGGSSRPSSCHIHPASSSSSSSTTTNNSNSNALVVAATISLSCPSCRKIVYFDENGAQNLPRYRAMQTIVDKFSESSHQRAQASSTPCQLCDTTEGGQQQEAASVFCQQCQVFYCDRCRENCHPARGPLAKHSLISPHQGRQALRSLKEKFKVHFFLVFKVSFNYTRCTTGSNE